MKLVLVRHGAVQPPRPRMYYGGTEVPLSETGRAEAAAAAAALRDWSLQHVVCSPLSRARYGAELIASGRGLVDAPEDVAGLREIDRGHWVGRTEEELRAERPHELEAHRRDPEHWRAHGGESLGDLRRRVLAAREELQRRWSGQNVALVAHLYPIRTLVAEAAGLDYAAWEQIKIPTGSISILEFQGGAWRVRGQGLRPAAGEDLPKFST